MQKIVFNKPVLVNKRYVIYLDSENKFTFNNKRAAQDFLVQLSKETEQSILFITEEFNSLEEFYRLYYLTEDDYKFKYLVQSAVEYINNRLAWIHEHHGSPNHDCIVFQAINSCMDELRQAFEVMRDKAARRKDTITKRRCALKIDLIEMYHKRLTCIGIKSAEGIMKIKRAK